jgi:HPt (histidine-containing phosphotransfer) domain-containing protein
VEKEFIASGMNDLLMKPIKRAMLNDILEKWIPAEKLKIIYNDTPITAENESVPVRDFWNKIEQVEGISVQTGLNRVLGQRDVYEKSLMLMSREIEKCDINLSNFLKAGDMRNFSIEVHSMKGSLANIGAMELSTRAKELETASGRGNIAFCALALPPFLEELRLLKASLAKAFETKNRSPIEIPAELPPILERLKAAFDEMDFSAIDEEIKNLDALIPGGALKDEIEKIKDAVLVMDYENAREVIRNLLA